MSCLLIYVQLLAIPSSGCDITVLPGFDFGRPANAFFSLSPSLTVRLSLSPLPLLPQDVFPQSSLRHGVVSRSDWSFPHPLHSSPDPYVSFRVATRRQRCDDSRGVRTRIRALHNGLLLRNIVHDVIHSLHKGRYYQSLRRNMQTIGARLVGFGYLTITVFWCSYLLLPC